MVCVSTDCILFLDLRYCGLHERGRGSTSRQKLKVLTGLWHHELKRTMNKSFVFLSSCRGEKAGTVRWVMRERHFGLVKCVFAGVGLERGGSYGVGCETVLDELAEVEELGRGEQDQVQSLHHQARELQVRVGRQDLIKARGAVTSLHAVCGLTGPFRGRVGRVS